MWASSRLGDSACFHIDTSDRERRERDSMEFECRNVPRRYRVPSLVRLFHHLFVRCRDSRGFVARRGTLGRTSPNESVTFPGQKTIQFLINIQLISVSFTEALPFVIYY